VGRAPVSGTSTSERHDCGRDEHDTVDDDRNRGHDFGDALSLAERTAVIEYLKTL